MAMKMLDHEHVAYARQQGSLTSLAAQPGKLFSGPERRALHTLLYSPAAVNTKTAGLMLSMAA